MNNEFINVDPLSTSPLPFVLTPTADGSTTFFSTEFGETFHSIHGARLEAELKFVHPAQLKDLSHQADLTLLDICYGLGYNTAAALTTIWAMNPHCRVRLVALERDGWVPKAAVSAHCFQGWTPSIVNCLNHIAIRHYWSTPVLDAQLIIGDARQTILGLVESRFQADVIFLDPFSPPHCPQLWTVEFLSFISKCLLPHGCLVTYSCAAAIRSVLQQIGLHIGNTPPVGRRSPGTVARWYPELIPVDGALTQWEWEHLLTRAATPYRDPTLKDDAPIILARRQKEQSISILEPTSQWRKRWRR
ncbi:MAG: hypothetical protein EBV05_07220 [Cyanobacteria bacterium WB6_1B_304]|jgi:tRNA U34 5-methylaminomethyl-2-thiouridine-forming methyltransferase MnmC|nr:hypothetical protein [Cyanobacteria bacterium WB6_1B_304]